MMQTSRGITVAKLGTAVTLAYASTYYLPAIVAVPMARSLGVDASTVFLAFSAALLVAALTGPVAGRWVDRHGGRRVLSINSLVYALGLGLMALAQGPWGLFAAWLVLGVAMGAGLYETSFATLVRLYGTNARSSITGITLIGGLASTVGWPLSTWLEAQWGWRGACAAWAGLHLVLGLPLHRLLPVDSAATTDAGHAGTEAAQPRPAPPRATPYLLAFAFGVTWFVSTAMAAHLPRLLQAGGVTLAAAIAFAAFVGPAQVAGRLLEYGLVRRVGPLLSARVACLAHAAGAAAFLLLGAPAGLVVTLLHGMGNGIMTIANGTLPLVFYGPKGYGARQGLLMMPARFAQAMAPFLFGLAIGGLGVQALWLSGALGIACFAALLALRPPAGTA